MKFIKKFIISGATIFVMTANTGCATTDEQSNKDEKAKIVLFKDAFSDENLSNSDRVCFNESFKKARDQEEKKWYYDSEKREYALKCWKSCGGAFIQKGRECKYVPSKYEFDKNACLCNGQDIIPFKDKENIELELKACQQICKSANTETKQYTVDAKKTLPFGECVCKVVEENKQKQY